MADIHQVIAQKQREIQRLEKEIAALQLADAILSGSHGDTEKSKSQPEMVTHILEEVGKPMHVTQIADQMKSRFQVRVKTTNLGVLLYRYAQRNSRFYKVKGKPNTYGLAKWQAMGERAGEIKSALTDKVAS